MKIDIQTIPNDEQRYNTIGDWYFKGDALCIRVSDMGNKDYEFLVALHELIEVALCANRGITQEAVDTFDITFKGVGEPGDDPNAPYFKEHKVATIVEGLIAKELGVDWQEYGKIVDGISGGCHAK